MGKQPAQTPKGKDQIPDAAERSAHEDFLVAKGLTRAEAKTLLPGGKDRKQIVEITAERLRSLKKKSK